MRKLSKSLPISEQQLVNQIIGYLNYSGYYVWRNNSGRVFVGDTKRMIRFGLTGSSDIVGITPKGKFIAIECKVGKNKTTLFQDAFLEEIRCRHGIQMVVYSLDELTKKLKEI